MVPNWGPTDITHWLSEIGLAEYKEAFIGKFYYTLLVLFSFFADVNRMSDTEMHAMRCPLCALPVLTICQYTKHLQIYHGYENRFKVKCHDVKCHKSFTTVAQYRRHKCRNHGTKNFCFPQTTERTHNTSFAVADEEPGCSGDISNADPPENVELNKSPPTFHHEFKKRYASYMLSIKERHLLPDSVQKSLSSDLEFLVRFMTDTYRQKVEKGLVEIGVNAKDSPTLVNLLGKETLFDRDLKELGSKYKLQKYVASNFPYVAPKSFLLSTNHVSSVYH